MLGNLNQQQLDLCGSSSYQDDSSQLQSFANSPDILQKKAAAFKEKPPLTDISPVKNPEEEAKMAAKPLAAAKEQEQEYEKTTKLEKVANKMITPSKDEKIADISVSENDNDEEDEDEDVLDGDIRFEMYSPEEEEQQVEERMRTRGGAAAVSQKDLQAVAKRHDFDDSSGEMSLLEGMSDFLSKKRQDCVSNITGFFNKLDEMEQKLKVSQEKIEKDIEAEQRAEAAKEQISYKMTQAIRQLNDNVDREGGMSRSSGGATSTTRGSDSDLESSFSNKQEQRICELREMKQAYEDVASRPQDPHLYDSVVNPITGIDYELFSTQGTPNATDKELIITASQTKLNSPQEIQSPDKTQQRPPARPSITSGIVRKKKKYARRLVNKPAIDKKKKSEKVGTKAEESEEDTDVAKVKQAFAEIQSGIMDVLGSKFIF